MKRIVALIFTTILFASYCNFCFGEPPEASRGVLDLSSFDYYSQRVVKLKGQWFFEWKRFSPTIISSVNPSFIQVPGNWNELDSPSQGQFGYCTYGLVIILPDSINKWALHIPTIHSAYRLFINNELVAQAGQLAKDDSMLPEAITQVIDFVPPTRRLEIVLEVSNFYFSSGGMWSPIELGSKKAIENQRTLSLVLSGLLIGSLMMMGLYHFALFIIWKKNGSSIYFGIVCIFLAVRESFGGDAIFFTIFQNAGYEMPIKLLYSTFPICLASFVFFISSIYPSFSKLMKTIALITSAAFILAIILTSNAFYGNFLYLIFMVFSLESCYWVFLVIRNFSGSPKESSLILFGIIILVLFTLNDILFEAGSIESFFLLPFGFFIFVLCQSLLLAIRFSRAFKEKQLLEFTLVKTNALKDIHDMKNRFFSNITHEFRTPLSLIISPIEKILQGNLDKSLIERSLITIHRSAIQLLQLINQLLDLSKLEASKMEVTKFRGDPHQFLQNVISSFSLGFEEKNISVSFSFQDLSGERIFDAEKLEKICFNLLSNSLKFTPVGGTLSVDASLKDQMLLLKVKDTGVGITQEKLPHIFERFYQADNSLTRSFGGTGIGLALVKELVDLVGGAIRVESELSVGTIFHLQFPMAKPESGVDDNLPAAAVSLAQFRQYQPIDEVMASSKINDGPLILLVEDNIELLDYIQTDLSRKYRVITAVNGKDAWQICEQELPDLVVSDVMMPEMNGYDLCKQVKETQATNHIGVILLTAKGRMENKVLGLSLGANDYLPKPFHQRELELRISNFLQYKQGLKLFYSRHLSGLITPGEEQTEQPTDPFLQKLYEAIDQSIDNPELSVNDVATTLAVSSRTLNRKLASMLGLTTNEVIRNYRLRKAVELLRSGSNVSEAAYQVGFESPSYFGQCFKEVYKATPSEFIVR